MAGASSRVVEILITGNSSQAIAEIEKLAATTEASAAKSSSAFANFGKAATLGIAGAAVAIGVVGIKLAEEGEVSTARLKKAVDNAGQSWDDYSDKVASAKAESRDLGFSGGQVSESLTKMVNVTKSTSKALDDLTLAEDIARGRKIDLSAATDLLAKVESGHVSLLGRLGIQTKDATGATISQEEAIKKLTDMYGGQASAYADTFQGKIAAIAAQAKYLAAQVGAVLIPIIEKLGDAIVGAVGFFEQHRAAAIALAAAIGTVLVPAMLYWIGTQVVAAAVGAASLFETAAIAALYAAETISAAATATASFAAAASGPLLIAAAFVAVGSAIDHLVGTGGQFEAVQKALEKGEAQGKRYGDVLVATAKQAQDPIGALRTNLDDLRQGLDLQVAAYKRGQLSAEQAAQAQGRYEAATKALKDEIAKETDAHKVANVELRKTAQIAGVDLPVGLKLSTGQTKEMTKGITDASAAFSTMQVQALVSLGETGTQLQQAAKDAKSLEDAVTGAMSKSTDAFAHFGSQTDVSEGDFEKFFTGSLQQASDWSDEVSATFARFAQDGTDGVQQLLSQLASAGPESKPALDAFNQMVDIHGIEWVDNWISKGSEARKAMVDAVAEMQFEVEQRLAELRAAAANPIPVTVGVFGAEAIAALKAQIDEITSNPHEVEIFVRGALGGV